MPCGAGIGAGIRCDAAFPNVGRCEENLKLYDKVLLFCR